MKRRLGQPGTVGKPPILTEPAVTPGPERDVARLGQVFTPPHIVDAMLALRRNSGRVLEPSCGDGAFSSRLPGCVAIEPDRRHAPKGALSMDFFAFAANHEFNTIVGNPPYVRFQDIAAETKARLPKVGFDGRSNLYLFFIEKSLRHLAPGGELIFITPRDFLKSTSSVKLNRRLYELGTITDFIELGDARIFDGAVPNCAIWRFERDDFKRVTRFIDVPQHDTLQHALAARSADTREFMECAGHLLFTRHHYPLRFSDLFFVKVGAVSGDDGVFASDAHGNLEFVCSQTAKTGRLRRMIYDQRAPYLEQFKERLLARRIRSFDESNWWQWGRGYYVSQRRRIYVNSKTRITQPFFVHSNIHYDGAVLAIFPIDPALDVHAMCDALNDVDWADLGFVCDGRFLFTQRSLENAPLPQSFAAYLGHTSSMRTLAQRALV